MKKSILLVVGLFIFPGMFLLQGCGNGTSAPVVAPVTHSVAFLRSTDTQQQPMLAALKSNAITATNLGSPANIFSISTSADGTKITFDALTEDQTGSLVYVMNSDGSGLKSISGTEFTYLESPVFSPDGKKVLWNADMAARGGEWDIVVANADGSGEIANLTATTGACDFYDQQMSPDGSKIVAAGVDDETGNFDLYTMNADGSNIVNLTQNSDTKVSFRYPTFSPDGTKLYYTRLEETETGIVADIYSAKLDGTTPVKVSSSGKDLVVRVVGDQLVLQSYRDGNAELYVMDTNGGQPTRLTTNASEDGFTVDSPWASATAATLQVSTTPVTAMKVATQRRASLRKK